MISATMYVKKNKKNVAFSLIFLCSFGFYLLFNIIVFGELAMRAPLFFPAPSPAPALNGARSSVICGLCLHLAPFQAGPGRADGDGGRL